MQYKIKAIKKVEVINGKTKYPAYEVFLEKPVSGIANMHIPAKTKNEAIAKLEAALKS